MAKRRGEPVEGTMCRRCGKICKMEQGVSLKITQYYRDDEFFPTISSNHKMRTLKSIKLCEYCASIIGSMIQSQLMDEEENPDEADERLYASSLRRE